LICSGEVMALVRNTVLLAVERVQGDIEMGTVAVKMTTDVQRMVESMA
jgi:hypothetical protein